MNSKEYNLIAGVFYQALEDAIQYDDSLVVKNLAYHMAAKLVEAYPDTFHKDKFLKACGL